MREIVEILQIGFAGFAFLMAGLSFRLLRAEAHRDGPPRKQMLAAIQRYTTYTLVMAVLVVGSRVIDSVYTSRLRQQEDAARRLSREAETCRDALDRLVFADARVAADYEALLRAVQEGAAGCKTILQALEQP